MSKYIIISIAGFLTGVILIVPILLITLIALGLMIYPIIYIEKNECQAKAKVLNLTYEYDVWTGCVITKENGKKVLLEQMKDYYESYNK